MPHLEHTVEEHVVLNVAKGFEPLFPALKLAPSTHAPMSAIHVACIPTASNLPPPALQIDHPGQLSVAQCWGHMRRAGKLDLFALQYCPRILSERAYRRECLPFGFVVVDCKLARSIIAQVGEG